MNKELNSKIDGVYRLMADAYNGNWKFRWGGTPYFDTDKTGSVESVVAHEWGCSLFWLVLRRACPALDKAVNSNEVYEILLTHDLGETHQGDISRFRQLQGHGEGKHLSERDAIDLMTQPVESDTRLAILNWFDEFEKRPEEMTKLEVLVAKFIDSLQGDHFALTFGHDLPANSELISKIVNKHTVPYARRLMEVLEQKGHFEAKEEVLQIFRHHIEGMSAVGIKLDTTGYPE